MTTSIRFIAEYYNTKTGEVLESQILRSDEIKKPMTIKDLGYFHEDQIALIQIIQDIKLRYETLLLNQESDCPKCDCKIKSNGIRPSNFHVALTDHKIKIQKRRCPCGWNSPDTIDSLYGASSHPDLIEKQVIQGAEISYRQASRYLNAESKRHRSINNDDRIRRNVSEIAKILEKQKLKPVKAMD